MSNALCRSLRGELILGIGIIPAVFPDVAVF